MDLTHKYKINVVTYPVQEELYIRVSANIYNKTGKCPLSTTEDTLNRTEDLGDTRVMSVIEREMGRRNKVSTLQQLLHFKNKVISNYEISFCRWLFTFIHVCPETNTSKHTVKYYLCQSVVSICYIVTMFI